MAAWLYGQAAEQGYARAQYNLGKCYAFGEGVDADKAQAAWLFGQAAEQGNAEALLIAGRTVAWQDARAAVEQYRLAVDSGCTVANASLVLCFAKGRGVPSTDPAKAARLYALAAAGGINGPLAYNEAMTMLPDNSLAPGVPSAAALARTRYAVHQLNLAARLGYVAAAQQLEALAGRRDVVSACCVGCGTARKLKTCSKCRVARFCDTECTARMWLAHKASCKAWRAEAAGSGTAS
jgi:TPR repeat protein